MGAGQVMGQHFSVLVSYLLRSLLRAWRKSL